MKEATEEAADAWLYMGVPPGEVGGEGREELQRINRQLGAGKAQDGRGRT